MTAAFVRGRRSELLWQMSTAAGGADVSVPAHDPPAAQSPLFEGMCDRCRPWHTRMS